MFQLRLLGGASLVDESGPLSGRATQRRRLALLAILAIDHPRPVPRDRIVAWLWPEHDAERARHLLRDSLYILRGALGDDAVPAIGDDLRLDPERLRCDLWEFDEALQHGRLEEAVRLYQGPLLDGVHLSDGVELERRLDAERRRVDQRYAAALEALAQAAESRADLSAAERWWRELATRDPYNGRVALRLMRVLESAGDRAGALRHARSHAALLRSEFETAPDAEVTAFAERLRVEQPAPADAATSRPAPLASALARESELRDALPASSETPVASSETTLVAATPIASAAGTSASRLRWALRGWVATVGVVAVLAVAVSWNRGASRAGAAAPPDGTRSIAVLPFVNMSPDTAAGYFSDGLSEQIITALSRVPGLRVAARTSSFSLRDRKLDVRAIGDTLGVETVLEGSVRRDAGTLRITAQLIDARTGYHIWSAEYDRPLADVLALQDQIAGEISGALELRLPAPATPSRTRRPPDPVAYDLYLRALHLRDNQSAEAMRAATELLDRAIELQPDFALAWAEKANVMGPRINFGSVPRAQGVAEMRTAVTRALELEPELGEAHTALGILRLFFEWDWEGAGRAFHRAVQLNPSDPHAWHNLANYLSVIGRFDGAVDARHRGIALDPLNARWRVILALDLRKAARLDEALVAYERGRQLDPTNPNLVGTAPGLPIGAEVHVARGRPADAVEELVRAAALRGATPAEGEALRAALAHGGMREVWRRWLALDLRLSGGNVLPFRRALLLASSGDTEQALDWLERAHAERSPGLVFLHGWALSLPELRAHPRYARLAHEMRLPVR